MKWGHQSPRYTIEWDAGRSPGLPRHDKGPAGIGGLLRTFVAKSIANGSPVI